MHQLTVLVKELTSPVPLLAVEVGGWKDWSGGICSRTPPSQLQVLARHCKVACCWHGDPDARSQQVCSQIVLGLVK